ncbi:MAG: hypothetical protein JSR17_08935 [Proteobacteria bacterium]|nr:hypothetical protein [Pseudomonadota bacterium]
MQQLSAFDTKQISGGFGLIETALVSAVVSGASVAAFGWKPVAMAPVALTVAAGATLFTTIGCIPVAVSQGKNFFDGVSIAFNFMLLGPKAGWELEKLAL